MASCKLTLIGMYNYDNSIFDGLTFPAGINKQTAVDEIMLRSGEFEVNYPQINFMKMAITHWGEKHFRTFKKWIDALNIEFEPLFNFDRYEEYDDSRSHNNNTKSSKLETATNSSSMTSSSETGTTTTNDVTLTHDVSAYDANTYQPRDQEITDGEVGVTGSGSSESNVVGSDIINANDNIDEKGNETLSHRAHLYGNIGVTTSTQMLEDYIRVERFNIYEQIADIFIDEFCICVYE